MASEETSPDQPVESPGAAAPDATPSSTPEADTNDSLQSRGSVDDLLAIEDPAFAASMSELHAQVATDTAAGAVELDVTDVEIKQMSRWMLLKTNVVRWIAIFSDRIGSLIDSLKDFRKTALALGRLIGVALLKGAKAGAHHAKIAGKDLFHAFKGLPRSSKLLVVATLVLGVISLMVLRVVARGHFLPTLENHYLRSFAEVADKKFTFDSQAPMEDFTDPIHHPEHVVLVDKVVVNLRRRTENSNPMGLFEFYIDVSSDEGAIEIKDRDAEIRDLMSRTIEQMYYDELRDADGKNKLKLILRKNLNTFVTRGRVRRVYFRNVVLKE